MIHNIEIEWTVIKNQADVLIHNCANYYLASISPVSAKIWFAKM